jgi:hypothetical protein
MQICDVREIGFKGLDLRRSRLPSAVNSVWSFLRIHLPKEVDLGPGQKCVSLILLGLGGEDEEGNKAREYRSSFSHEFSWRTE